MSAVEVEAEKILALSPIEQRIRLTTILNRSLRETAFSKGNELALDFNARLVTRLREIAKSRGVKDPWTL